jgi:hypothetical protein
MPPPWVYEGTEPRRDFIRKHALEVIDIDYHGA